MSRWTVPLIVLEAGYVLAWSSGFIGAELALAATAVWPLLAWRFALTAVAVGAVAAATGALAALRPGDGWRAAAIGLLAQGAYLVGVFQAQGAGVPAGLTALIAALHPPVVAVLAGVLLAEAVRPRQWLGLALGGAGVVLAVGGELETASFAAVPAWAYLWPVLSVAALSAATLLQRRWPPRPLAADLAVRFAASAGLFAGLALAGGAGLALDARPAALGALAWLVLFSTLGGYGLLWVVVARGGATRAASLTSLTPAVTALWAFAVFGERLGGASLAGFGVALAGLVLVNGAPPGRSWRRLRRGRA